MIKTGIYFKYSCPRVDKTEPSNSEESGSLGGLLACESCPHQGCHFTVYKGCTFRKALRCEGFCFHFHCPAPSSIFGHNLPWLGLHMLLLMKFCIEWAAGRGHCTAGNLGPIRWALGSQMQFSYICSETCK